MKRLGPLPELIFEVSDHLNLKAATEAGLAEIPESEMTILRLVTNYPGCGVAFLTERTKAHQANVSATVRALVGRGLISKEPSEIDRRAVRLYPSEQALRDLDALRTVWLERLVAAFDAGGVDKEQRTQLLAVLKKVRENL